jgi:hypothetical protein
VIGLYICGGYGFPRNLFGEEHDIEYFKKYGFVRWPKKVEEAYWRYFIDARTQIYLEYMIDAKEQMKKIGIFGGSFNPVHWGHIKPVLAAQEAFGLQQVIDRPFGLSEWITVYPALYSADGPAIIAAYGMGLQGWDASYEFQSQAQPRPQAVKVEAADNLLRPELPCSLGFLSADEAQTALSQLEPVRFNYKADKTDECLGFIAEDVPALVATADRKGLSPMDIVAVLTKVVQEQKEIITAQQETICEILRKTHLGVEDIISGDKTNKHVSES